MTSGDMNNSDPNAILACTVCRDVQNFDLLIVDMEEVMGEQWGDLGFEDALQFFEQPEADSLEFIALAIDDLEQEKSLPNKVANTEDIKGDIFDLVMGRVDKRTSDSERTAFVFRGLALGDLALTSLVIKKAGLV